MATLREQIATTALTVTKFRELLRIMRANRPGDDLELVRKATSSLRKTMPVRAVPPANPIWSILSESLRFSRK